MPLSRIKFNDHEPRRTVASSWLKLERNTDDLPGAWRTGEILHLENVRTLKFKETATEFIILAELAAEMKCSCGGSESKFKKNGMTEPLVIYDLPIRNKWVGIYYRAQRYYCSGCGKTTQQYFAECSENHRLTKRLLAYIEKSSLSIYKTFAEIAIETGVREHVIRNVFTNHCVKLQRERKFSEYRWIAIDELYPTNKRYRRCVISAPEQGEIIDLLPDDKKETITRCLNQIPDKNKIKFVTMDLYSPYRHAMNKALTDPIIVADRYHVQNLMNRAVSEVLVVIRASLTASEKRKYMRPEHLLLRNKHNLEKSGRAKTEKLRFVRRKEKEALEDWFREMPDIAAAYTLKEKLADILHLSDRDAADDNLRNWLAEATEYTQYFERKYEALCKKLRKHPFRNIPQTISSWFKEILNYVEYKNEFSTKLSNAFAEYANNQIKKGHRRGNGYFFDVLRYKVVFGDFLKKKFSPHLFKTKRRRGCRKYSGDKPINLNSNINRLIEAREDSDGTTEAIRASAENLEKNDFKSRFSGLLSEIPDHEHYDLNSLPEIKQQNHTTLRRKTHIVKTSLNNDLPKPASDQLSLFEAPAEKPADFGAITKEKRIPLQASLFGHN